MGYLVKSKHVDEGSVHCTTGGYCQCAKVNGQSITLNGGFNGDDKVMGCEAFSGDFAWQLCCKECGTKLESAGMLKGGWDCEQDWIPTGIWLKGDPIH